MQTSGNDQAGPVTALLLGGLTCAMGPVPESEHDVMLPMSEKDWKISKVRFRGRRLNPIARALCRRIGTKPHVS